MDFSAFTERSPGALVPISGRDPTSGEAFEHWAFLPDPLPEKIALSAEVLRLVEQTALNIGRLDQAGQQLPNPSLLVRPAIRREAVSTSALEGTYAAFTDVLEADYVDTRELPTAVAEVANYVRAAEYAVEQIRLRPLSVGLLCELQRLLVRGTPGEIHDAGEVRSRQVYIGARDQGIERSRFVPPPAGDQLRTALETWEAWIDRRHAMPFLVEVALAHYGFEAVHPFSDGNGRLGRLIVILELVQAEVLGYPILNPSPWLQARSDQYQDHLLRVSQTGEFDPWIQFFLEALNSQAQVETERIDRLQAERNRIIAELVRAKVRGTAVRIAEDLIGYPLVTASDAANRFGVTFPTANNAIARLVGLGVLHEITGRPYGRMFIAPTIVRILERP